MLHHSKACFFTSIFNVVRRYVGVAELNTNENHGQLRT